MSSTDKAQYFNHVIVCHALLGVCTLLLPLLLSPCHYSCYSTTIAFSSTIMYSTLFVITVYVFEWCYENNFVEIVFLE